MTIEVVPQSITRDAYLALMRAAGFDDPNDLRLLEFRSDGIYAEVMPRNDQGNFMVDKMTEEIVVDRIFIPVKD